MTVLLINTVSAADIDANDTQLISACDDEIVSVEKDLGALSNVSSTYSELSSEIGSGGNITLKHDYYAYDSGESIEITDDNSVINGNGAIIDMAGSHVQAFKVNASGVTIKDLTIKNANVENYVSGVGGAIYFSSSGFVENCNFLNNIAYDGGAVYFRESGEVTNSNFENNSACENGGGICFWSYGKAINCNFTNNKAFCGYSDSFGGAIFGNYPVKVTNCDFSKNTADCGGAVCCHVDGEISDCRFADNYATQREGAISMIGEGEVINCNFTNNSALSGTGAVCISTAGKIVNCNFASNHAAVNSGAVYISRNGKVTNSNFTNNSAAYGGAIKVIDEGDVTCCSFTNNTADCGGAIEFDGNGKVTNCNFVNCIACDDGGAIYFDYGSSGTVTNCSFTNCYDQCGDAIYGSGINVVNSNFTNGTIHNYTDHGVKNGTVTFDIVFYDDYHIYGETNIFGFLMPKECEYKPSVLIDGKAYRRHAYYISDSLWAWGGDYKTQTGYMVKFSDLNPGNHEVVISYPGDSQYAPCSIKKTITVHDDAVENSKIIASNVKVTYSTGSYYTIKTYESDGSLADGEFVKISGKISKILKTKNGIAKFKVTQAPGTYKMKISALGKSITRTLTVKHIVTLKTVAVKKFAKKLTLQANLAKANGKYLKNKAITFKFNGKTFKTKTNSKGIAKVTVKSNVLKKLKVGKKVMYQATYIKDTVKKTAKVQK